MKRDIWSSDPDRTTRNNDTRTSEQVTAKILDPESSYAQWCAEQMEH